MRAGIPCYASDEAQTALEIITGERARAIVPMKRVKLGNFTITPFEVPHDEGITCYGYLIEHKDIGKLLFVTDLEYCPYSFRKQEVNHIICECNYDKKLVDENYDKPLRDRVLETHMEVGTCMEFLATNNNPQLRNVILCHLSNSNAVGEDFRTRAEKVVDCDVYVAHKGLEINLDEVPF